MNKTSYTKEQINFIILEFRNLKTKEKKAYANEIGHTVAAITAKCNYELKKIKANIEVKTTEAKKAKVESAPVVKTIVREINTVDEVIIMVGEVKVTIPSRTFKINGVEISC